MTGRNGPGQPRVLARCRRWVGARRSGPCTRGIAKPSWRASVIATIPHIIAMVSNKMALSMSDRMTGHPIIRMVGGRMQINGSLDRCDGELIEGWVTFIDDPGRKV